MGGHNKREGRIFFSKINKKGGPNKSVEGEKFLKLNKRVYPSIKDLRELRQKLVSTLIKHYLFVATGCSAVTS